MPRPAPRALPAGARLLDWLRALPDHRLLDRLIGGRVWIVLIGTLLVGIVSLQLSMLKLNAGIGRAVQRGAGLEQANAALSAEISRLSDPQRIVDLAARHGFVTPLQGSPRFVTASAGDARRALRVMRVPSQSATSAATATAVATTAISPAAATAPVATSADPTAAGGTMTTVPTTSTSTTTSTSDQAAGAPDAGAPAAPTGAATTTGTPVTGGGAAAPQG
jgi:hypothetical protein